VGQGDAALVEAGPSAMLIDSGPGPVDGSGGRALLRALAALGCRSLDALVITHADLDHRGGARRVLETLPVEELWLPIPARGEPALEALARLARERGAHVRWLGAGDGVELRGAVSADVLWPPADASVRSRNEASLVLAIELRGIRFLFAADIGAASERTLMRSGARLNADVLKIAHHGSRRGSGEAFLDAVAPRIAVLSAPCEASRGLPSGDVLDRLRRRRTVLAWTGRDGAIAVEPDRGARRPRLLQWASARRCRPGRDSVAD
jgi:competence protein ComEC